MPEATLFPSGSAAHLSAGTAFTPLSPTDALFAPPSTVPAVTLAVGPPLAGSGTVAPGGPASSPPPGGGGGFGDPSFMVIVLLVIGGMFLFTILSSRKERKRRDAMLGSLKKHDRVQTIGGVIGSVVEVKKDLVVLKVDESSNTRMTFAKSAVQQVLTAAPE